MTGSRGMTQSVGVWPDCAVTNSTQHCFALTFAEHQALIVTAVGFLPATVLPDRLLKGP